jgi:hypothetical protein
VSVKDVGIWTICWLIVRSGNGSSRRNTCLRATSFTTNPTRTDLLSNPNLCNEKPATNRLNHDTVLFLTVCIFFFKFDFARVYPYLFFMIFLVRIIDASLKTISISQTSSDVSTESAVHISSELPFELYLFTNLRAITRDLFQFCVFSFVINVQFISLYNSPSNFINRIIL